MKSFQFHTKSITSYLYWARWGLVIFCIYTNVGSQIQAQSFSGAYHSFTIEQGLPSNETYSCLEDRRGYIWISTDNGVARYDGMKFETFTTSDGLPDNTIFKMYEDWKGRIWFFTYGGKVGFYYEGQFHTLDIPNEGRFILTHLQVTRGDTVWFKVKKPFFEKHRLVLEGDHVKPGSYRKIPTQKEEGEIDLNTFTEGLDFYNMVISNPDHVKNDVVLSSPKFIPSESLRMVNLKKYRIRAVERHDLLVFFDAEINPIKIIPYAELTEALDHHAERNSVSGIGLFGDKIFVTGTGGTIKLYDTIPPFNMVSSFVTTEFTPSFVMKDRFGGVWICTLHNGVRYIPNPQLEQFFVDDESESVLQFSRNHNKAVIANNNKEIKVCSDVNEVNRTFTTTTDLNEYILEIRNQRSKFIVNAATRYLILDSNLKIESESQYKPFKTHFTGDKETGIHRYDTQYDTYGNLIGSSQHGLYELPKDTLYWNPGMTNARKLFIRNDTVWIGSLNGLYAFDQKTSKYIPSVRNDSLLSDTRISGIVGMKDNALVLISRGEGVMVLHNGKNTPISVDDGLKWKSYQSIVTSNDSTAWVSSVTGLSRIKFSSFNPLTFQVDNFGKEAGFWNKQINDIYYFDDSIYIALGNKVMKMPQNFKISPFVPPIEITSINVNGRDTLVSEDLDLPYDLNSIGLKFYSPYLPNAEEVQYLYRVNDNTEWIAIQGAELNLLNLQPGEYTISVVARLPNGKETKEAKVNLRVNPPFWQTVWAYLFYVLLAVAVAWLIFKIRLNRARKEEATRRKMAEMELKALRSQMNPHFTFNTMNSIQYFINANEPEQASAYIARFSRLMRMILDNSREEFIIIERELEALKLYLEIEKLRFQGKFEYSVETDDLVDLTFERMPPMVIQPYVENAIWHGLLPKEGDRKLSIKLYRQNEDENGVYCVVEDNGIGRKQAMENKSKFRTKHKSHGMNITQTRLELLNEMAKEKLDAKIIDLYDDQGKPIGTRVEVFIPTK